MIASLYQQAEQLDAHDPLHAIKAQFVLPENMIYLDGNSLGPVTHAAKQRAHEVVEQQWQPDLIKSWNQHNWIGLPQQIGAKIAPLIGAHPDEVIACDSISVNLYKLLHAALAIQESRYAAQSEHLKLARRSRIVTQQGNFPTDGYIAQGLVAHHAQDLTLDYVAEDAIVESLGLDVAVLMLTHVNYKTGYMLDMAYITEQAHALGIVVIWDLAHTTGVIPIDCTLWNVDFAVGCGYKYLNGGPGAPAFVYAAARHHAQLKQPLSGWMGHAQPFAFTQEYIAGKGMLAFLCGTPAVISMSILDAALDVFSAVTMEDVRYKSAQLTRFCLLCIEAQGLLSDLPCISPEDSSVRGSQLAFTHPQAYAICQAMIAKGVVADFRAPDVLRLGFAPLYVSYQDIVRSVEVLSEIINAQTYLDDAFQVKHAVT
jgi:kynureninase